MTYSLLSINEEVSVYTDIQLQVSKNNIFIASYGYQSKDIEYNWMTDNPLFINKEVSIYTVIQLQVSRNNISIKCYIW